MGHWYTKEGHAQHWQENGKPTTLREARKENLFPSVTTILDVLNKQGLNEWKTREAIKTASVTPRGEVETEYNYLKRVMAISYETTRGAADFGTEFHREAEKVNLFLMRNGGFGEYK